MKIISKKNARGHKVGKLFFKLQNAGPKFRISNEETLKGKIKSIKTVTELNYNIKRSKKLSNLLPTSFSF